MITIEQLRVRVGLDTNDSSKDAEIMSALTLSKSVAETYCNRKLFYAADFKQVFTHLNGTQVSLKLYPVIEITSMSSNETYDLHEETGLLYFEYFVTLHRLEVVSSGGYETYTGDDPTYPIPADLQQALLMIFDRAYIMQGGESAIEAGELESVTVQDVGTVRFVSTAKAEGSMAASDILPSTAVWVLDLYSRTIA